MAIDKKLLREVADRIASAPALFDMSMWSWDGTKQGDTREACGTTACIAGEVCLIRGKVALADNGYGKAGRLKPVDPNWKGWSETAKKELGLTNNQAARLFHRPCWPDKFQEAYMAAEPGSQARACAAVARIKHFCDTDGKE